VIYLTRQNGYTVYHVVNHLLRREHGFTQATTVPMDGHATVIHPADYGLNCFHQRLLPGQLCTQHASHYAPAN
jgi:hypothetical protein